VNDDVLLTLSEVDEPRKGGADAVFPQEWSKNRNSRLTYVPQQICARVCYLDEAHSGLPAGVDFPAG